MRNFVSRPFPTTLQVTGTGETLEENTKVLQRLATCTEENTAAVDELNRTIKQGADVHGSHNNFIDAEVRRRIERIRKYWVFAEFNGIGETRSLVASLVEGELMLASKEVKFVAFSWCARFLSDDDPGEAESTLNRIDLADTEMSKIARSVIKSSKGDLQQAINDLCNIGTPVAYGAAYINVLRAKGFKEANKWLQKAGLRLSDLDSAAKFSFIRKGLEEGDWDVVLSAAKELSETDWDSFPGLLVAAADAFLVQTAPCELRMILLAQNIPFEVRKFPLRGDTLALEHRRTATQLYERFHSFAKDFGLKGIAGLMDEKVLWLRLVDPESTAEALRDLEVRIKDMSTFLRFLGLGLQLELMSILSGQNRRLIDERL